MAELMNFDIIVDDTKGVRRALAPSVRVVPNKSVLSGNF